MLLSAFAFPCPTPCLFALDVCAACSPREYNVQETSANSSQIDAIVRKVSTAAGYCNEWLAAVTVCPGAASIKDLHTHLPPPVYA